MNNDDRADRSVSATRKRLFCHITDHTSLQMFNWMVADLASAFPKIGVWVRSYNPDLQEQTGMQAKTWPANVSLLGPLQEKSGTSRGVKRLLHEKTAVKQALEWKPDVILQFHNSVDDSSSFLNIRAFNEDFPVFLLPSIKQDSFVTRDILRKRYGWRVTGPVSWLARLLGSFWVHEKGKPTLRVTLGKLLALEMLGLAPKKPWVPEQGNFKAILVENKLEKDRLKDQGVQNENIVVTGSPVFDHLYTSRQKSQPQNKPIALVLVPPMAVNSVENIQQIQNLFYDIKPLAITYDIHLSIHPRLDKRIVSQLDTSDLIISDSPIEQILANCDLLIGSSSNVLSWGAALGIDVIDFDIWHYQGKKYGRVPGIKVIQSRGLFLENILDISVKSKEISASRKELSIPNSLLSSIDGNCSKRIIDKLLNDI